MSLQSGVSGGADCELPPCISAERGSTQHVVTPTGYSLPPAGEALVQWIKPIDSTGPGGGKTHFNSSALVYQRLKKTFIRSSICHVSDMKQSSTLFFASHTIGLWL